MKLYTAAQIREWDAYTIAHEPIASADLMERAAGKCVQWLLQHTGPALRYLIVCGKGNNGGDGLAIARLLHRRGVAVEVYILEFGTLGSPDFQTNLQRLHEWNIPFHFIQEESQFPHPQENDVLIDALFGSGLNRPLEGLAAALVRHLNQTGNTIVSIDVPSGLMLDASSQGHDVVRAAYTLSFQATKMAFLLPENETFTGQVAVLDIALHPQFSAPAPYELLGAPFIKNLLKPRSHFAHKGTFGHALLIGGSYGKIGAMVLSATALLRSGVGLTTVYIPRCGYPVLQTAAPEAMTLTAADEQSIGEITLPDMRFSAIGIGPGMGTAEKTQHAFAQAIKEINSPMVIDADGLNCLAQQPHLLQQLPPQTVLTPHPKEFERLFGPSANDFERIKLAQDRAAALNLVIVLKGHHSFIASPQGPGFFNNTGNAGMATGGSGDVLTGLLTGLLAQDYEPLHAALIGVYLHGLAGDLAAAALSQEAMIAGDITRHFGAAFKMLAG